jgi:3-oxoacyl-[acyl-carrier-protein] synthase-3
MPRAAITAVGHYVPEDVYPNSYFESYLDTSDEWIRERTGIRERRFARNGATSDLIVPAARMCLEQRGITPADIDCIIVATVTPDYFFPSTAAVVQRKLGAVNAWGFDLSAACSGFIFALVTAAKLVESGAAKRLLLCGADKMSAITWTFKTAPQRCSLGMPVEWSSWNPAKMSRSACWITCST